MVSFSLSFKSLPLIVGVVSPSWFMCHGWLHQSVFVQNHVHTPLIIRICLWNHVMAMVLTRLLNVFIKFSLEKIIISVKDFTHCHVVHYLLSYIVIWRIICDISILRISTKTCYISTEIFVPYTVIRYLKSNIFSNCHYNPTWEMNTDNGICVPFIHFFLNTKERTFLEKFLEGKPTRCIP